MANNFENDSFSEEDRSAMEFVLGQCIKNVTNEQLQDILTASLEIASIPKPKMLTKVTFRNWQVSAQKPLMLYISRMILKCSTFTSFSCGATMKLLPPPIKQAT